MDQALHNSGLFIILGIVFDMSVDASRDYISMSYRSIPKKIREMIEQKVEESVFLEEVVRPRYSFAVQKAAKHYYMKALPAS